MLPWTLLSLLSQWLSSTSNQEFAANNDRNALTLQLRHHHATTTGGRVLLADVPAVGLLFGAQSTARLRTRRLKTFRPHSQDQFARARWRSSMQGESERVQWEEEEVLGPDVDDRETLLTLAKMTYDAYVQPSDDDWYDLGDGWQPVWECLRERSPWSDVSQKYPFGWEPDADGFRGYVFATPDNSTVVLSIKGTSAAFLGRGGGPTARKDKQNDNLLFSCCCAHVDWTWTTVCDCFSGGWKCNLDCLQEALVEESLFYPIGTVSPLLFFHCLYSCLRQNLYNNLTYMYPNSNIWVTGHSLGGALASLVGITFGAPVVAFESPGEKMASQRLHLPSPVGEMPADVKITKKNSHRSQNFHSPPLITSHTSTTPPILSQWEPATAYSRLAP